MGRFEEAISSFDSALGFNPDNYAAWVQRGLSLDKLGRIEEALACYDSTIKYKHDSHHGWMNRAYGLADLGRFEEAIASCDSTLKYRPGHEAAIKLKRQLQAMIRSGK